jgi:hypothetical protein
MRASEYYAAGIHGFFINFGLDAIEQRRGSAKWDERVMDALASHPKAPTNDDVEAYLDLIKFDNDDGADGCFCAAALHPPCYYCEHSDDGGGR